MKFIRFFILFATLFQGCTLESQNSKALEVEKKKNAITHAVDYIFLEIPNYDQYILGSKEETDIEIPSSIIYFDKSGNEIFNSQIGICLSGMNSRKLPQKSIAINFSKARYNSNEVNFSLFQNREYDIVDEFIIRAHGNPLRKTYFKDAMMNESLDKHTDLTYSAVRPVVVYINDKYYGLYNIREKKNKDLIHNLYGYNKEEIFISDVHSGKLLKANKEWDQLFSFIENNDLSSPENYKHVASKIDIRDLIDYHLAHTFFANTDWPKANVKVWKAGSDKWRYIFFDCDRGYGNLNFNSLEHLIGENQWAKLRRDSKIDERLIKSSLIIRKLSENKEFINLLIIRYQDLLNTSFSVKHQQELIEMFEERISPEVERHIKRWYEIDVREEVYQNIKDLAVYNKHIDQMLRFASKRPDIQRKQLDEKWNLGGFSTVVFNNNEPESGRLKINTIEIDESTFEGKYFNKKKIKIQAIPTEGYTFVRWKEITNTKKIIEVFPSEIPEGLTAIFKKI